jgi:hypothetical protein
MEADQTRDRLTTPHRGAYPDYEIAAHEQPQAAGVQGYVH